jgi:hypothetical protein
VENIYCHLSQPGYKSAFSVCTCVRQLWTLSPRRTTAPCARRDGFDTWQVAGRTGRLRISKKCFFFFFLLFGGLERVAKRFFFWSFVELSTLNPMVSGPPRVTVFLITKRAPGGPTSYLLSRVTYGPPPCRVVVGSTQVVGPHI